MQDDATKPHARDAEWLKPRADIAPNTAEYETLPLVKPTGFREYDARWLHFGEDEKTKQPVSEINLPGVRLLGMGLGTLLHEAGVRPAVVVGHDYRSYSQSIKQALIAGLLASGVEVHDIGLALSPTAYFAQEHLNVPGVAMVTASHNENGWTGVKMGMNPPLTFGPDEMGRLKEIVLSGAVQQRAGGSLHLHPEIRQAYIDDLIRRGGRLKRKLKVVCACGNGTAGLFAPVVLRAMGVEVIELHCRLDHAFPHYNPNPEAMEMLEDMAAAVKAHGADLALGFDGDGDRCGVVDNEGHEIFADKIGVLIARDLARKYPGAKFVADVKSTALFATDPVLKELGAETDYYKTGHSYIKRRTTEIGALAGFEKSGHFFFRPPLGLGYDDGIISAIAVLHMLDANPDKSMAELLRELPRTWATPTMAPHCPDEVKYDVVARISDHYHRLQEQGAEVAGQRITHINTVNGIRFTLEDGSWGLVRASSNKPELVVVCESPTSEAMMRAIWENIRDHLATCPEVGEYNQTI